MKKFIVNVVGIILSIAVLSVLAVKVNTTGSMALYCLGIIAGAFIIAWALSLSSILQKTK